LILLDLKILINTVGVIQRNVGETPIRKINWKVFGLDLREIILHGEWSFFVYKKSVVINFTKK